MAGKEKLVCPVTGEICEYQMYCDALRSTSDKPVITAGAAPVTELPQELNSLLTEHWCSTDRLNELGGFATLTELDADTKATASTIQRRIQHTREMFHD